MSRRPRPAAAPGAAPRKARKPSAALIALRKDVNENFGDGTLQNAADAHRRMRSIPLGHLIGDLALLGGLPEGQASMFLGREGGGKTTQAMRCVAGMQRKYPDKIAFWADTEETFDPYWAESHGVDMDRLELVQVTAGEDIADTMKEAKAKLPELGMMVLDSVNQTTPMKEYADSVGDAQVALHPRLMGRMCSALGMAAGDRRKAGFDPVTEIFINQWRTQIGFVMGDPRVIPGGKQLGHYCSTHLEFKAKPKLAKTTEDGDGMESVMYVEHTFNARRTKIASSLKTGEYHVVVGPDHHLPIGSYDEAGTVLTFAKKVGLYHGTGKAQYFTEYDKRFGRMDEAKRWLENNPAEMLDIKRAIIAHRRQRVGLPPIPIDGYLLKWQ